MILHYAPENIVFSPGPCRFEFTPTGDIRRFCCGDVMLNRLIGNSLDGSPANLWLRVRQPDGHWCAAPLLGCGSGSSLSSGQNCLEFSGHVLGVDYLATFHAYSCGWRWEITLQGHGETVDVIYGQDLSLGIIDAVLDNDLYLSQYLGHTVMKGTHGYVIGSRQNLPQNGTNPYLQIGMLEGCAQSYSTDATQFFGLDYKLTNTPSALAQGLPCCNYQFECAYPALQSAPMELHNIQHISFYGLFLEDHPQAVTHPIPLEQLHTLLPLPSSSPVRPQPKLQHRTCYGPPLPSSPMSPALLARCYPTRKLEEWHGENLLSFFIDPHVHVVMQEKEVLVERPHANILTTFVNTHQVDQELITTTCAMPGLFNGQTVIGNTNRHKLLSASRGLLNRMKHSGMRIWIEWDGVFRQLTMPAVFETGLNYCKWIYLLGSDTVCVETFAAVHSTDLVTQLTCTHPHRFLVTCQLVMGTHEFQQDIQLEFPQAGCARVRPATDSTAALAYPDLCYTLQYPEDATFSDDRLFYQNDVPQDSTLCTLSLPARTQFSLRIHGTLDSHTAKPCPGPLDLSKEKAASVQCYTDLIRSFSLKEDGNRDLQILNETVYWFAHNAMVHFAVPHGLEQPGGAAWGTRDICQGPFSFLMATQHYELVRDILKNIFRHQNGLTGEWPQWFMFDRYRDEMPQCHGDVIFWPLKCVATYLAETGDISLLEEVLPYTHTQQTESLLHHIQRALDCITTRFLPGTALLSYAGGDWDDTLQPCSQSLQQRLVSSWTQALAYQVLQELAQTLPAPTAASCADLAEQIRLAFERYLVIDGVIAGFVCRQPDGSFQPMLHPRDQDTGIHLRLIPMTRSILAGLSSQALARSSISLIEQRLHAPDGVRLMDHPAQYSGGVSRLFRRAEQAANVGREVSLQYTHAHIRYIEAACRMGDGSQAWRALFEVNPICLHETVPNALPRQSNLYFSSSDGVYPDRWEYNRSYDKLMSGSVPVKGGWRLYSSGPGIYIHCLLRDILGVQQLGTQLRVDPVLPQCSRELSFSLEIGGRQLSFCYHCTCDPTQRVIAVQGGQLLPAQALDGLYRRGGILLPLCSLNDQQPIHIFFTEEDFLDYSSK